MSLKVQTLYEKAFVELFKECLDLLQESASAYFDLQKGSVSAMRINKIKLHGNKVRAILELM